MPQTWEARDTIEPISDSTIEQIGNSATYNVQSGCALTYDAADMTVDLAAGVITHDGDTVTVAGGAAEYTLVAAPSNPRWTWLGVDSTGAGVIVSGDPAATPTVPELGDNVGIALVYVQAGLTIADNATYKLDKRVPGLAASAIFLRASSDTPVATTSTSQVDIVAITGLSIPVTSKVIIECGVSKDALAAQVVLVGFKVNATEVRTPVTRTSGTQQAEDGVVRLEIWPQTAATPAGMLQTYFSNVTATGAAGLAAAILGTSSAPLPVATITSITITGFNNTSNNNLTIEWYRVWELPL